MIKKLTVVILLATTFLVAGCNKVKPQIELSNQFWEANEKNVAIAVVMPEESSFYPMGDVRLLDYAIISGAMAGLKSHIKTLQPDDFRNVRIKIAGMLEKAGYDVVQIEEPLDLDKLTKSPQQDTETVFYAEKDFAPMAPRYGVSKLLLIELNQAGVARNYHGFIPLDDPHAIFSVKGQLVDLSNNKLLWNTDTSERIFSQGNWDEPPAYPGLTESFFIAMEGIKSRLVNVFNTSQKQ